MTAVTHFIAGAIFGVTAFLALCFIQLHCHWQIGGDESKAMFLKVNRK